MRPTHGPLLYAICAACVACAIGACQSQAEMANANFSAPAGMAAGGRSFDRLFVANAGRDSLQVMALAPALQDVDLVPSPARYFPLDVPAPAATRAIAASWDGAYIFALSTVDAGVQLIDADTLQHVLDATGAPLFLQLSVSPAGDGSAILGGTTPCAPSEPNANATCLGRAYVALPAVSQVAVVDVRRAADGTVYLQQDRSIEVGAPFARMALDANETALFCTDARSPQLWRVPVSGAAPPMAYALGSLGSSVVVSQDDTLVAVARPQQRDVVVLAAADGVAGPGGADVVTAAQLSLQDANPIWTPVPQCFSPCLDANAAVSAATVGPTATSAATSDACAGAPLADLEVCVADAGLGEVSVQGYGGIYVGGMPAELVAVGPSPRGPLVPATCTPAGAAPQATAGSSQVVAVANFDGSVRLLQLRDAQGNLDVRLIDRGACGVPSIMRPSGQHVPLATVLAACPPYPSGRRRYACLPEGSSGSGGVGIIGILRGQANGEGWSLVWEGVVPQGGHEASSGRITADGALADATVSFDMLGLQVAQPAGPNGPGHAGDILQVVTLPRADAPACQQSSFGGTRACDMERRIVAVRPATATQPSALVLDRPLEPACYPSAVAYLVRAGDAFVVAPLDATGQPQAAVGRLALGDVFAPGFVSGPTPTVFFAVRRDLDAAASAPACTRYDVAAPGPHPSAGLVRDTPYLWTVADPFAPAQLGAKPDPTGRDTQPAGCLPAAMRVVQGGQAVTVGSTPAAGSTWLAISYAGSDAVVLVDPYVPYDRDATQAAMRVFYQPR